MERKTKIELGILAALAVVFFGLLYINLAAQARQMLSQLGRKWSNLNPDMQKRALQVINALAAQGITVGIPSTGGWRSTADQQAISPSNTRVVDPRDSYHVWGLAVDFVPINDAGAFYWPPNSDPLWQQIGNAIRGAGLTWGGDFKSITDMPHGELHLDSLADLKANYADPLDYINENNGTATA